MVQSAPCKAFSGDRTVQDGNGPTLSSAGVPPPVCGPKGPRSRGLRHLRCSEPRVPQGLAGALKYFSPHFSTKGCGLRTPGAYGLECKGRERCSEAAGVAPDGFGRTLRVRLRRSGGRILTPLPRSSPTWARRYAERSALERVNARLDDGFRFERHAVRGKDRMAAKVGLAPAAPTSLQNLTAQLSRSCTCG